MPDFNITAEIKKLNEEERMVYGFASVADDGSGTIIDRQGDTISEVELVKAAHRFMKTARDGKVMHEGNPKAEIVESMVLRPDVAKALGVEDFKKTAWVIGMKVHDDATWERVKKGELKAFSIGGKGKRKNIQKDGRAGRDGDGDGVRDEKNQRTGVGGYALSGAGLGARLGGSLGGLTGAMRGAAAAPSFGLRRGRGAFIGLASGGLSGIVRGGLWGAGLGAAYGMYRGD